MMIAFVAAPQPAAARRSFERLKDNAQSNEEVRQEGAREGQEVRCQEQSQEEVTSGL
jgi:hypothetical protein